MRRSEVLQWDGFGFGRAYILPGLVEVTFWSFNCFGIILLHITRSEERPTNKVPCLDRLEPCRFYRVATYRMHPFDGLCHGGEIVYAVGVE